MQTSWFSEVLLTIKATWLCIKYPFLYPRNRFTGLHYNWKWLRDKINKIWREYHVFNSIEDKPVKKGWYYKETGHFEEYWINCWALPVCTVLEWIHNNPVQWCHCLTNHTELDALPKAWVKDFGIEWAKDVKTYLKKYHIKHYRIGQLKEKWGEFDWLYPPDFHEALEIEHKYIERSKSICICCGRPATKVTPIEVWKSYYCDHCAPPYAHSIHRTSVYLAPKETRALKEELVNIDGPIELIYDDGVILKTKRDTELMLSEKTN